MIEKDTILFRIFRFDPVHDKEHSFREYRVPFTRKDQTVLEALFYIQQRLDDSLAFRSSCMAGICGSCAMHINGKYRLACNTLVSGLKSKTVTIRPLARMPVHKDLFVDMKPFWEKYEYIKPYIIPGKPLSAPGEQLQTTGERSKIDALIDCILCACCHSSCPVTASHEKYPGPMALLQTDRFLSDTRDRAGNERLAMVNDEHGVWRCHTVFNCQEVCPKRLDPSGSIAKIKTEIIKNNV
ncbi:MAG: succinate dehydrogenase iron-sulfur subunit [Candidatus Loosdrechtia sp.]|uniref:succinate dehydrogenase iron-sulfur subunit n=1 Tax=Candidatus Loosdrechtia sp. TaxID=3101272 RepID=UPI003A60D591|nr:MAG: succinate dehydrogenase iron-sulfur subunit [Candidatus Jettenia sp. AMX2]